MTTGNTKDDATSTPASITEIGLTEADQERIRKYLDKPPHLRSLTDLVPDTDASAD